MITMKYVLLFVLGTILLCEGAEVFSKDLINKNVERVVDLSSQLVKITATITLENAGKETLSSMHVQLEPELHRNLSHILVRDAVKDELALSKVKIGDDDKVYKVTFNQPLSPGRSAVFVLEYVLINSLSPYPSSIAQKERQLVRYFGNHYFYSPYNSVKQTTSVTLNSRPVESYTKLKPVQYTDSQMLMYGPYNNVAPRSFDAMVVHYENNAPFLRVTRLERLIEISHWGNIAVQEDVEILHTGAKLKGSFSRYDYQRDTSNSHHSIKSYRTVLPAAAHSIYYRDSNGNISTSQVRARKDWIELELRPRFPLFGGWKSSYTLGYSVPSYQYLYKLQGGNYMLRMRLLDHIFDDMHVEELEASIVLPVGVKNVKINLPYQVERLPDSVTYKYLDNLGRQVIRLRKRDLVEQHIQDLEIVYDWQPMLLVHEPILIAIALYALFLLVIVYVRLDFGIHKGEHVKAQ